MAYGRFDVLVLVTARVLDVKISTALAIWRGVPEVLRPGNSSCTAAPGGQCSARIQERKHIMSFGSSIARSILFVMIGIGLVVACGGALVAIRALAQNGFLAMAVLSGPLVSGIAMMAVGFVGVAVVEIADHTESAAAALRKLAERDAARSGR